MLRVQDIDISDTLSSQGSGDSLNSIDNIKDKDNYEDEDGEVEEDVGEEYTEHKWDIKSGYQE